MPFKGNEDPFCSAPANIYTWRYAGVQPELNRDGNGTGKRGIIGPSTAVVAVSHFQRSCMG